MTVEWASDENFTSGAYSGLPTKIAPSAGLLAQGIQPENRFGAQHFNWLMNYLTREAGALRNAQYAQWFFSTISGTPTLYAVSTAPIGNTAMGIAVGAAAAIFTAPDFVTWTSRTAGGGYTDALFDVTGNGTLWCAVGETGGIQTATYGTGVTWTKRTAAGAYTGDFYAIVYNPTSAQDDFVAVGETGGIQTSNDGATWTQRTAGSSYAGTFTDVAHDTVSSTLVAVGSGGEIQYSTNGGVAWTRARTGTEATGFVVARPGGGFVVAFDSGSSTSTILTSSNGVTWSTVTQVSAAGAPTDLLVGPDGRRIVVVSGHTWDSEVDDLATWTRRLAFPAAGAIAGTTVDDKFMVLVGSDDVSMSLRVG